MDASIFKLYAKRGDNNIPWQLITTHNKLLLIRSCNNKTKKQRRKKQEKKTNIDTYDIYMTVHSPGLVHAFQ